MTDETNKTVIVKAAPQAPAISTDSAEANSMNMMAIIANAAKDPSVDVSKMTELVNLQERIADRQARQAYIEAKENMQSEMPVIGKRGEILNKSGGVMARFATWDAIHKAIMPILKTHCFVLDFKIGNQGNMITVEAVLSHVGGHVETGGAMPLPADTSGAKNAVQGMGSSLSYGKRYTTCAMLNILTEGQDDDGTNAIMKQQQKDELKATAKNAAKAGLSGYQKWFLDQNNDTRLSLTQDGTHEECKMLAREVDESDFPGDQT